MVPSQTALGSGGSFSLKSVLPALVPGLSYDDLAVASGFVATRVLQSLIFRGDTAKHVF